MLARAFARAGAAGLAEALRDARDRRDRSIPKSQTITESLGVGARLLAEHNYELAMEVYVKILGQDPHQRRSLSLWEKT